MRDGQAAKGGGIIIDKNILFHVSEHVDHFKATFFNWKMTPPRTHRPHFNIQFNIHFNIQFNIYLLYKLLNKNVSEGEGKKKSN